MHGKYKFWLHFILILSLISTALVSPVTANPTRLYVDPPSIIDTGLEPGTNFTININVQAVTNLFAFEFKLKYKTAILTATKITLGDFFPPPGAPPWGSMIMREEINDIAGYVWYSVTAPIDPGTGETGSGTLATINFTVDAIGGSCLYLSGTSNHMGVYFSDPMLGDPYENPIVHEVYDGHFVNDPVHDIAITSVIPLATEVLQGQSVNVTVVARNHGNFTESFTVTAYANTTIIEIPKPVTDLVPANLTELTFTWNTTGVTPGKYIISANATAVSGEIDTTDNTYDMTFDFDKKTYVYNIITITKHPIAIFNYSPTTPFVNEPVTFNASDSKPNGGKIDKYYWDFGDGETSDRTLPYVYYAYQNPGPYTVTLTIKDSEGLTDTTSKPITIYMRDVVLVNVTASPTEVTKPEPVSINVTVANKGGLTEGIFDVIAYYDGQQIGDMQIVMNLEAGANKTLEFTWDTTYVSATVEGTTYSISAKARELLYEANTTNNLFINGNVTVYKPPGPSANFTYSPETPSEGEPVNFDASLSTRDPITNASITSYAWDFGDGTTEIYMGANLTDTATHPYATAGSYTVKLNVTDSLGYWDAIEKTVTVYRHDVAIISVTPDKTEVVIGELVPIDVIVKNEGGLTETFNVTAYFDNTDIETIDVPNLAPGASTTLTFTWDTANKSPRAYTIKANATVVEWETEIDDNEMFFEGSVTLFSPPIAKFAENATTVHTGDVIHFNATDSYDPDGEIVSYAWDFGDGTTQIYVGANLTATATHAYDDDGTYTVTLTVTDDDGLTNSTSSTKTVLNRPPVALFTESATTVPTGEVVYFNATNSYDLDGNIIEYFWTFGDGTDGLGALIEHAYDDDGTYTVTLTVTDDDGESDSSSATKTVSNRPPVASFTESSLEPMVGDEINFTSTGTDPDGVIESWEWDFNSDGTIDATTEIATWTYDEAGTYTVSLTVTDNDGLTDTTTKSITVNEAPAGIPVELIAAIGGIIIVAACIAAYYLIRRRS